MADLNVTARSKIEESLPQHNANLHSKSMADLMDNRDQPWVDNILKADSVQFKGANILNPTNQRQNAYGLICNGIALQQNAWGTRDGTVKETLENWTLGLNDLFPPKNLTSPKDLLQLAVDLEAAGKRFAELQRELGPQAELTAGDKARLGQICEALVDGAAKVRGVYEAWKAAPGGVDLIELDFRPQQGH